MNLITQYPSYLKDNPNHYWFKRKLYGWGWTPATWQGWLTMGIFIAVIVVNGLFLSENPEPTGEELA